ncbi:hypothetical protein [Microvirga calopogonii]|uniref:hypothetical protein n=1 Tax=Microvirga calopogonii TaxID=2078013 RepID=UPI0013B414D3|nr:hypothetical protein [Microvirga calopogonii]
MSLSISFGERRASILQSRFCSHGLPPAAPDRISSDGLFGSRSEPLMLIMVAAMLLTYVNFDLERRF